MRSSVFFTSGFWFWRVCEIDKRRSPGARKHDSGVNKVFSLRLIFGGLQGIGGWRLGVAGIPEFKRERDAFNLYLDFEA